MAEYAVECVDRKSGDPYVVRVQADTYQQAVESASKDHVAGRAHRIDFSQPPKQGTPSANADLLRLLEEQSYLLRRIELWSMRTTVNQESFFQMVVRATVYTVTALIVSSVISFAVVSLFGSFVRSAFR